MADVKLLNGKYTISDTGLVVTSGDLAAPEESLTVDHDGTDATATIGKGSLITEHTAPVSLADDGTIDLVADTAGHGFLLVGDAEEYVEFVWTVGNTVTAINQSSNVSLTDTDGFFCVFDNTTSVRIRNRLGTTKDVVFNIRYTDAIDVPTFQAFAGVNGVDNLDPSLTSNSTTVTPAFRFKGGDADGTDWDHWIYGAALTLQAGTVPTYNDGSPCLGDNDDSVLFNAGGYYLGSGDTGYLGTEDFVLEVVFQYSASTNVYMVGNWNTATSQGWLLYVNAAGSLRLYLDDTSGTNFTTTTGLIDGAWYHYIVFGNRDEASANGCVAYLNGVQKVTDDISAMSGTLASADLAIGAASNGTNGYDSKVAYAAMWKQAAWHAAGATGPTEWATIAAERFARLCGYYPQVANGTAMPTVSTRAFAAYLDKIESSKTKLYYVGAEWLRMCNRQDSLAVNVNGYLSETQAENLITESEDFLTTWTLIDAGDAVLNDQTACPDGRTKAGSIAGDATDGQHGVEIAATLTAATHVYSIFANPGDKDWIYLNNSTVANCDCYFDVANGTVGTSSTLR